LIEYLQEENRVLHEQLDGKRLLFTDAQRGRLARKAKCLGRRRLREISTLVTPDTLLRWYRERVAAKYDGSSKRRPGRIVRMALENPSCEYTRIRGALMNLGHEVGRNTIKRVLVEDGIDPVGWRPMALRSQSAWDR
jgi:hypothetical protein